MTGLSIDEVMANVRDLPTLPLLVTELISTFGQPDVSIGVLAAKVSNDQALTAKTLRLANSSFYGLQSKVRTIEQAITVLGFDSVRALVTSAGVMGYFAGGKIGFDFAAFWRHAVGTALCARAIARRRGCNPELAFVSGLLHDIGRLVLATGFPALYADVIAHSRANDCDLLDAERLVLGIDHAVVGRALAQHWKFPDPILLAIGNHHAPTAADLGDMPSVVHIADAIVHALDLGGIDQERVPSISQPVWDSLHLDNAALRTILSHTEGEFGKACEILIAST
ncbi:HDOD domain-containing protein [Oxalobacteraceae sp. CFBP 8755]|nr:HDOD domain-containing protein [Oxalobacteraceae sp. CFBP 8753]MBD8634135.1 HDOD domain-containing protein [Oxalobacteraceae sp. CFBP 8755]